MVIEVLDAEVGDVQFAAEDAPLSVLLCPVLTVDAAPDFTLVRVAVMRDVTGRYVQWVFWSGRTRTFDVGELVAARVPLDKLAGLLAEPDSSDSWLSE